MTSPLVIGALAIGGVYLAQTEGVLRPRVSTSSNTGERQFAGDAAKAAMDFLRARKAIAGVSFVVPASNSPLDTWKVMRDTMVAKFGKLGGELTGKSYPRGMTATQLADVCAAWISASDAGRAASTDAAVNYALVDVKKSPGALGLPLTDNFCNANTQKITGVVLSPLGRAMCECRKWRNELVLLAPFGFVTDDQIRETFDRSLKVAAEMEGADYVTSGVRVTELDISVADVAGGVAAAGAATGKWVAGIAGDAAGAIAGAIVGSPAVWALGLGALVYLKVLR